MLNGFLVCWCYRVVVVVVAVVVVVVVVVFLFLCFVFCSFFWTAPSGPVVEHSPTVSEVMSSIPCQVISNNLKLELGVVFLVRRLALKG